MKNVFCLRGSDAAARGAAQALRTAAAVRLPVESVAVPGGDDSLGDSTLLGARDQGAWSPEHLLTFGVNLAECISGQRVGSLGPGRSHSGAGWPLPRRGAAAPRGGRIRSLARQKARATPWSRVSADCGTCSTWTDPRGFASSHVIRSC